MPKTTNNGLHGCQGVSLAPCAEPSRSDPDGKVASGSERAAHGTHGARGRVTQEIEPLAPVTFCISLIYNRPARAPHLS